MEEEIDILKMTLNKDTGMYNFKVPAGGNLSECFFAIAAFVRSLARDNYIESKEAGLEQIKKYLEDPQYDELKE